VTDLGASPVVKAYPRRRLGPLVVELVGLGVLLTLRDPSQMHTPTRYIISKHHSPRTAPAEMIAGQKRAMKNYAAV